MPEHESSEHLDAAWAAAPAFGLEPESISVISRSENVVCAATLGSGERLIMRLHRPGYNNLAELDSEVQWVAALADAGIPVPAAVPTVDGGHYTETRVGDAVVHVGVVRWVDGKPLGGVRHAETANISEQYQRIGELSAAIHEQSIGWTLPDGFVRRRWNTECLLGDNPLWGRFWEVAALSDEQRTLFADARSQLTTELNGFPTDADHFGLIHADLHLGNLMADGDGLTVIDFDDAGFGWFPYELAISLHPIVDEPWFPDARAALVQGYRSVRPLGEAEESWIETFLAVRALMIVGWLADRPEVPLHAHFDALAAQTERIVRGYLAAK
ncbi:MAG: phosphotransferase [Actinomycetota bacterium]